MIWLLRHGAAEDEAASDAERRLTEKGISQARAAGQALLALGVELETCLTSPKARAAQTAQLAAEPLGLTVEENEALRGGDFDLETVAAGRGELLIVGHEPDLSRAIQLATGARVDLKTGGLAALEEATLKLLLRPRELRVLAGD